MTTTDFIEYLHKIEAVAKILNKLGKDESFEDIIEHIKLINDAIEKYQDFSAINDHVKEIELGMYACKSKLTFDEATRYMGVAAAKLSKMLSCRYLKFDKQTIMLDRKELDELLCSNPIYSKKAVERMATMDDASNVQPSKRKSRR